MLGELVRLADDLAAVFAPADPVPDLQACTATTRELFGAAACSIALLTPDEEELVFVAADGAGAVEVVGLRMPSSRGVAGWVVMSGEAAAVQEVRRDPRFAADVAARTGHLPKSILAAPLTAADEVLGVVEVLDRDADRAGSHADMQVLAAVAALAGRTVQTARVVADLGRLLLTAVGTASADASLGEALRAAAAAAPARDAEVLRVGALLAELAASPAERELAVRILEDVLAHARGRGRRPA